MKPKKKFELHHKNKYKGQYKFDELINSHPDLSKFVILNKFNNDSIDFANPEAVKALNTALLINKYGIKNWDIPNGYLCPPIPGRADYIHYISDLITENNITTDKIKCIDIGTGANCIYPIIGVNEYNWSFVGTDIDKIAIENAQKIINSNQTLKEKIELRLQKDTQYIFKNIIKKDEKFDITICNPPFHKSLAEAQAGTLRKLKNLSKERVNKITLNFGGKNNELFCKGGEKQFIINMVLESKDYADSCTWFSSLVSNQANLDGIYKVLKRVKATKVKTIKMGQGNKISRVVAWSFM